jgi:hypothetical protein
VIRLVSIRRLASVTLGKMLQTESSSPLDVQANYLRAAHVQPQGRLISFEDDQVMWFSPTELRNASLKAGDVVIVEGGAGFGRSAVLEQDMRGWGFQNSIIRLRPKAGRAHGRFLDYCLQSALAEGTTSLVCSTATIPHFTAEKVAGFRVPAPTISAQVAISDYLDRETAKIDVLINRQERLVAGLRERRHSLISEAVSGVGQDRSDWVRMPLRYAMRYQEGPGILAADFRTEGVPLLRIACVRNEVTTLDGCNFLDPRDVQLRWAHFRVSVGDLLISASASMGTISQVVPGDVVGSIPYTGIIRIIPGKMVKEFVRWYMISEDFLRQINDLKAGSTIQHFGPTHLAQMRVVVPPARIQRCIVSKLEEAVSHLDGVIRQADRSIHLGQERRAALITAAVTGQLDISTGKVA